MMKKSSNRTNRGLSLNPIGDLVKIHTNQYIRIYREYRKGLKHLELFSHALVFIEDDEKVLSFCIVKILNIDETKGIIQIDQLHSKKDVIIYDIKPYFPCEDRICENYILDDLERNDGIWKKEVFSDVCCKQQPISIKEELGDNIKNVQSVEIYPIGEYNNISGTETVTIENKEIYGNLKENSFARIIWWFDRFDKASYRKTLLCDPPYENAPKTGIFATRSPVRPNPIATTVVKIIKVDEVINQIQVDGFDGFDHSLILDVILYEPKKERIKHYKVPEWLDHWPKWKFFEKWKRIQEDITVDISDLDRLKALIDKDIEKKRRVNDIEKSVDNYLQEKSSQSENDICVYNANQNNLKDISVYIPKNKITVITGVSGSGKSSLAFDTIYAESQRQFMDLIFSSGVSSNEMLEKPNVKQIIGLQPAIAIEQKSLGRNPRSTVGTVTGISDYVKLLYSTIGTRHCPKCHRPIDALKKAEIKELLMKCHFEKNISINPFLDDRRSRKFPKTLQRTQDLVDNMELSKTIEEYLELGKGAIEVIIEEEHKILLQTKEICYHCSHILFEMTPSMFSYNHPEYMCPVCKGLGEEMQVDESLIISFPHRSLLDGASKWWGDLRKHSKNLNANWMKGEVLALAYEMNIDLETPYKDLPDSFKKQILYGSNGRKVKLTYENKNGRKGEIERAVEGAANAIQRLFKENNGETSNKMINAFMSRTRCTACQGERLNREGRLVSIGQKRYPEATKMTISELYEWLDYLCDELPKEKLDMSYSIINDLKTQLEKLINVGLSYLTLDRSIATLSGGESGRIRLASQFNTNLTNILYVMDEPTMGLHPRDYQFLIQTIKDLKRVGNTIIMVEHKRDIILEADHIIDIGIGAGKYGGEIIAQGTVKEIVQNTDSITGKYLAKQKNNLKKDFIKGDNNKEIKLFGARLHNLKNIDVSFPLGRFICVTGVSGSGKSSLVSKTLYPAISHALGDEAHGALKFDGLEGVEYIKRINWVSQQPIGRTPRSNPATYTGVFDLIRDVFAKKKISKDLRFKKEHFSFNSKKGQCEVCKGAGRIQVPMHFMPDIWVSCSHCHGRRYKKEILDIKHQGYSISDILEMSVDDTLKVFEDYEKISKILSMLQEVGLGYMKLGQSALTLSGGEAQRIKLAKELYQSDSNDCVFILDEPTTGLHFADIEKLINIIEKLTNQGNTVIAIEHNLDFICHADWIIDLGPGGGNNGGYVIAEGTPYDLSHNSNSVTGQLIKNYLI